MSFVERFIVLYPHTYTHTHTHIHTYTHTYTHTHTHWRFHCTYVHTVEPVCNYHSMDQVIVVSVDRWSLCKGALVRTTEVDNEPAYCGLYIDRWSLYRDALVQLKWTMHQPTVVSIDRWSFYASVLSDRFYCTLVFQSAIVYVCTYMGTDFH